MEKRNPGISTDNGRHPTKKSSLRNSRGFQSSKRSIGPRAFQETSDVSRRRNVRFVDPDNGGEQSFREHAPSIPTGPYRVTDFGEPKTSEYKFFKKLLEEAGSTFHFLQLHKRDDHLKKFETSSHVEETINTSTSEFAGNGPLSPTLVSWKSPSPSISSWRDSETNNRISCKRKRDRSLSPVVKVTLLDGQLFLDGGDSSQEKEYKHGEIFFRKRQNILKVVAEALSLDVEKFTLNGSELIPVLLQRLGIGSKARNHDESSKSEKKKSNIRNQFLASSHSDTYLEELHETLTVKPMPINARGFRGEDLFESWFNEVDELFPSLHDMEAPFYPQRNSDESGLPCKRRKLDFLLDFGHNRSASDVELITESQLSGCSWLTTDNMVPRLDCLPNRIFSPQSYSTELSLVPYCTSSISEFKLYSGEQSFIPHSNAEFFEFNILHGPDESQQTEKGHCTFRLLDWDWSSMENKQKQSFINSAFTEDPDHLPLTLYLSPNYHSPKEELRLTDPYEGSNIFSSQSSSFDMHQEMVWSAFDAFWVSSMFNFKQGWKSSANFYRENIVERRLSCMYEGSECDENTNESGIMKTWSQFTIDKFNLSPKL